MRNKNEKLYPRFSIDSLNALAEILFLAFIFIIPILSRNMWFIILLDIPLIFVFYILLAYRRRIIVFKKNSFKVFHTKNGIVEYRYHQIHSIEYQNPTFGPASGYMVFYIEDGSKRIKAIFDVNSEEYVAEMLNFLKGKVDAKVLSSINMELMGIYQVDNRFFVKVERKEHTYIKGSKKKQRQSVNQAIMIKEKYYPRFSKDIINYSLYILLYAIAFSIPLLFNNLWGILLTYIPLFFFLFRKLSFRRWMFILEQNSIRVFYILNGVVEYQYQQIQYIEYKTPASTPRGGFLEFIIEDSDKRIKAVLFVNSIEFAAEVLNFLIGKVDDKVIYSINMELWGVFRGDVGFVVKPMERKVFKDKKLVLGIKKEGSPKIIRKNTRRRRR